MRPACCFRTGCCGSWRPLRWCWRASRQPSTRSFTPCSTGSSAPNSTGLSPSCGTARGGWDELCSRSYPLCVSCLSQEATLFPGSVCLCLRTRHSSLSQARVQSGDWGQWSDSVALIYGFCERQRYLRIGDYFDYLWISSTHNTYQTRSKCTTAKGGQRLIEWTCPDKCKKYNHTWTEPVTLFLLNIHSKWCYSNMSALYSYLCDLPIQSNAKRCININIMSHR